MKKIILSAALILSCGAAMAQAAADALPANNIKLNLLGLAATNISLQYERALNPKTSVALGLGFMPKHTLPFTGYVKDAFLEEGSASKDTRDAVNDFLDRAQINGFSITPEFRYYLGKKPQNGFYLAPFIRYSSYSLNWDYVFVDSDKGKAYPGVLSGKMNLFGGGLMVGAQWYVKNFSIDWWIIGASYNRYKVNLDVDVDLSNLDAEDREELYGNIRDVTVKGKYFDAEIRDNGVTAKGSVGLPALRTGLCIGYRF